MRVSRVSGQGKFGGIAGCKGYEVSGHLAWRSGAPSGGWAVLEVGDMLLSVNGIDVTAMARIQAWNFMKKLPDGEAEGCFVVIYTSEWYDAYWNLSDLLCIIVWSVVLFELKNSKFHIPNYYISDDPPQKNITAALFYPDCLVYNQYVF